MTEVIELLDCINSAAIIAIDKERSSVALFTLIEE